LSTVGEYDDAIAGGIEFRLLGKSLGGGGDISGVRKTVRGRPSLGFCLITDDIINIREYFLDLNTK